MMKVSLIVLWGTLVATTGCHTSNVQVVSATPREIVGLYSNIDPRFRTEAELRDDGSLFFSEVDLEAAGQAEIEGRAAPAQRITKGLWHVEGAIVRLEATSDTELRFPKSFFIVSISGRIALAPKEGAEFHERHKLMRLTYLFRQISNKASGPITTAVMPDAFASATPSAPEAHH